MATYSPFNRFNTVSINNVSGSGTVVYTTTKNAFISASIRAGSGSGGGIVTQFGVYFTVGSGSSARSNYILWQDSTLLGTGSGAGYVNAGAFIPSGTQIKIFTGGNLISFDLNIFEID